MNSIYNKLIFELSIPGRVGYSLPKSKIIDNSEVNIPTNLLRKSKTSLPEVSENDVVRHYVNISNKNYGVDTGFYPLGSCTMKYNPKINEDMASNPKFSNIHPYQNISQVQGALEMMYNLSNILAEVTGMDNVSLNPFAGAHGELTGLMIMKMYHEKRNDTKRTKIIIPDSAHGTNPASASVVGYETVEVKSNQDGTVNIESLKEVLSDEIAGIMLTNPNTLGLFEKDILEISKLVHNAGGLLYYDGANLNAILGKARPGDMGFDIIHLNLHKTFSTPHGGGGPGSGPVGVKSFLKEYLPNPNIQKLDNQFILNYSENSIGSITGFYGNFGILVRAYTYLKTMGKDGLKEISEIAVLNANYLQKILKEYYKLPLDKICKHEFVLSGLIDKVNDITTLDVAKRLLDFGFHAPTVYFPLIVDEAIMIEPTETESKQMLDNFASVMIQIATEAKENPSVLKNAPQRTPIRRVDEVKAARNPILKWTKSIE